jgi:exopolysaccharide production protein ExoQ
MIQQVLGLSFYIGIAFTLAVACILALGLMLHAGTRIYKEPLPLLFFGIVAAIMIMPIVLGRLITDGLAMSEASLESMSSSFWINRIVTLGILALCAERILRFIIRREWAGIRGWPLFWAFAVFGLSNQILNGAFGSHPSFDHKFLYAFIIYFCMFLVAQNQHERCFRVARGALLFFLVGSALAAVFIPSVVIQSGYPGGLPGLPFRYFGLATHANTMGPLALVFMICLWRFPFHSRWVNLFSWFLVTISLALTQSKTTIIATLLIGLFLAIYRYRNRFLQRHPGGRSSLFVVTAACVCFSLSIAIFSAWFGSDVVERTVTQLDLASGGKLKSFTGRTAIWELAWQEFLASPLFGYGPSIWSPSYRLSVGLWFATTAHNQLLHSLSSAGIVGAAGLIFYGTLLIVYALRAAPLSEGISLALVGLMLFRSFTEAPFVSSNIISTEFFAHLLVLVACVGFLPARQAQPAVKTFVPRSSGGYASYAASRKAVP